VFEVDKISAYDPRVVLSDSRLSAIFAAKIVSIPVITVLNQLKILFPPRFRSGLYSALLERIEGDILGLFWTISDKLLFPDLPPPFTIGEANLSNVDVRNKLIFTGFMTSHVEPPSENLKKISSMLELDRRPLIFIQISGPKPTKYYFLDTAIQSAAILSREYNVVISKGEPSGSQSPVKLSNGGWLYDWCPVRDELFALSKMLIVRAGHATLSQCINAGKSAVVVPIFNQSEQLWNAKKFAKLGLGVDVDPRRLNAKTLVDALERCIDNDSFRSNAERVRQISEKFDGIETTADIIRAYL